MPKHITYLDLFSGTGGFALGLKQAGFVFKKHYFSEIDVHASANYLKNFKDAVQLGDIKTIGRKQIERPDVITFGSPCQDLSLAGKRNGLKGKRSGLFFQALRLIRLYRPRVFVFENVKGIFSSNSGNDFEAVLRAFADIGLYDCQWQLVDSAWFLPQSRQRLYLVGHLRGEARPKVFPIGEGNRLSQAFCKKGKESENIASAITSNYSKGVHGRGETYIQMLHWNNSGKKLVQEEKKTALTLKTENDLKRPPLIVGAAYRTRKYAGKSGAIEYRKDSNANQLTTVPKDSMVALKSGKIRRLTPIECERLQGFPDNWTKYGIYNGEEKEISDTQRYKMLGNAVNVVTVKAVTEKLLQKNRELGGLDMKYEPEQEIVLSGATTDIVVPELNVTYSRNGLPFWGKITDSKDTSDFIRSTFQGELEMQEVFIVLYLNQNLNIIGYYRHTKGTINSVSIDIRILLSTALKCLATKIIVAHNHPSQNLKPSEEAIKLTKKLKDSCSQIDIRLLDSIIVTRDSYFSFADNGMAGLEPVRFQAESLNKLNGGYKMFKNIALNDKAFKQKYGQSIRTPEITAAPESFVQLIKSDLAAQKKSDKRSIERQATAYGITDKTEVKELIELAIVETARDIGQQSGLSTEEKYSRIVELYNSQVNLSHRTSQSILLQQYSTPAPIAYLMGIFCGVDKPGMYLEPSAGNGMLTIAGKPEHFCVNEIDDFRYANLQKQGFYDIISTDASAGSICSQFNSSTYDAILTNPPFGKMDTKKVFDGYPIQSLEHVMAIYALMCMKDDGKAAIIIGGHTGWDAKNRMQAGKNRLFFNYLYSHYNVDDVIPINGKKLYSRQGTGFNTRLILINGRKNKVEGNAPIYDKERDTMVSDFDALYERVMDAMEPPDPAASESELPLSTLQKLYLQYLKLQAQYKGELIFLSNEGYYEVFGDGAIHLANQFGLLLSAQFRYKGKVIPLVRVKPNEMELLTIKLKRMHFHYIIADALQSPQQVELEKFKREAQKLLQRLRIRIRQH